MNNHQDGHADDFPTAILFFIFFLNRQMFCYVLICTSPKPKKKNFFLRKKKSRELPDCTSGINFIAFDIRNEMGGHERYEMMEETGTRSESWKKKLN
jgi:hypothetical protein